MQELTLAIAESLDKLDESHGFFFQLHHPDRERFEREGWPDQAATEDHHALDAFFQFLDAIPIKRQG
jgi:hypothetical protein